MTDRPRPKGLNPVDARPIAPDLACNADTSTSVGGSGPSAKRLQQLLGLDDDELVAILAADPLSIVSGDLEHRPELQILLDLLAEAEQTAGARVLRRWVRSAGPAGRPIDLLLARDFAAFEDALATLARRGWILRGPSRPAS